MPHSAMPLDVGLEPFTIGPLGPLYHCTSSGDWRVIKGMCECLSGYEPSGNQSECVPCKMGMYKWVSQVLIITGIFMYYYNSIHPPLFVKCFHILYQLQVFTGFCSPTGRTDAYLITCMMHDCSLLGKHII